MIARVIRAYKRHGGLGLFRLLPRNFLHWLSRPFVHRGRDEGGEAFDRVHGIETTEIREIGSLSVSPERAGFAVRYQASDPGTIQHALAHLGIDFSQFTFVDFGCGKGRVLMIAARYPFRRIIGVEFAAELHEIALSNLAHYRDENRICRDVSAILRDAADFVPEAEPLVCYFYNPFHAPVLERVRRNIETAASRGGGPVYVIYVDPRHREVFEATGNWARRYEHGSILVLEYAPSRADACQRPQEKTRSHRSDEPA